MCIKKLLKTIVKHSQDFPVKEFLNILSQLQKLEYNEKLR